MTSSARMYAVAVALLVFFLTWAAVAAKPWVGEAAPAAGDARVAELVAREDQLRQRGAEVQGTLDQRWAEYETALAERKAETVAVRGSHKADVRAAAKEQNRLDRQAVAQQAAAEQAAVAPPQIEIVTLPPITQSRSS